MSGLPAPDWPVIASEVLRLLATGALAFVVGYIAWTRGWLGQKEWDQQKLRYELFREEQRRRLDLLADMREAASSIDTAALEVVSHKITAMLLTDKNKLDSADVRVARARSHEMESEVVLIQQIKVLEQLAGRYGMSPETVLCVSEPLSDVIRAWKMNLSALLFNARPDSDGSRDGVQRHTGKMLMTLADLIHEEQRILVNTAPAKDLDPTRPLAMTRVGSSNLLMKKL